MRPRPTGRRAEFVARDTYRRRRMIDAAGLLPLLGAFLFLLPLLWVGALGGAPRTSHVMLYLFAVWALLVLLSALVSRGLGAGGDALPNEDGDIAQPDRDRSAESGQDGHGDPARRG